MKFSNKSFVEDGLKEVAFQRINAGVLVTIVGV